MRALLMFSQGIDRISRWFGVVATVAVLVAVLISSGNAASRYLFHVSSNAWLEIQWYLFAIMVFFGAGWTLKLNEHVRVDLVYSSVSDRTRLWIDTIGLILFLLPAMGLLAWMTWPIFYESWRIGEQSSNAGGLIRWPVKLVMPIGFALVFLQGLSELIKRIAALRHRVELDTHYEKPLQ
jgi:TRAP-type mannitol/chloroaromatic compound transport system permease small subunit